MLQVNLARLVTALSKPDCVDRVSNFLDDLTPSGKVTDQEQRNRLATELFEAVWGRYGLLPALGNLTTVHPSQYLGSKVAHCNTQLHRLPIIVHSAISCQGAFW